MQIIWFFCNFECFSTYREKNETKVSKIIIRPRCIIITWKTL